MARGRFDRMSGINRERAALFGAAEDLRRSVHAHSIAHRLLLERILGDQALRCEDNDLAALVERCEAVLLALRELRLLTEHAEWPKGASSCG